MSEHNINIELFKENHFKMELKYSNILYNDEYMVLLAGKTTTVKLDKNDDHKGYLRYPKITLEYADRNVLNSFETTMSNIFSEYSYLLLLTKKILINFIVKSYKYYVYDTDYSFLYSVYYFKKKFNLTDKFCVVMDKDNRFKKSVDILKKNNIDIKYNTNILDDNDSSIMFTYNRPSPIHGYTSYIEYFIDLYNKLIQLDANTNTYIIDIYTDYYIELIFDMIDILHYYFDNVMITRLRYNKRYNFILVLNSKINVYKPEHNIKFTLKLYRLKSDPINKLYVDFMNKAFNDRAKIITLIMEIDKMDPENKELILQKIKFYKNSYHIKFMEKLKLKD